MNNAPDVDENFVDFKCPHCGELVSFPGEASGQMEECFSCGETFIVPTEGETGRKIPLPLATPHLVLRRFGGADWKDLLNLFSNDEFCEQAPFLLDGEERVVRWLEEDAATKLTTPNVPFNLAVQSSESGKLAGIITLTYSDAARLQPVLQVALMPEYAQRGLKVEAVRGAFELCFAGLGLHRVLAYCLSADTNSCQTYEKAGMRREGEFVQNRRLGDEWVNTAAYAILRDEFKKGGA
jgi:RimJ/RimL family protein N-acetyltransferase